ncbi:MAG: hypothetical protein JXR77_00940 [Lentisphaeria bacterium]|nr:hypothetical protein [Lentisphaeria bacterium]
MRFRVPAILSAASLATAAGAVAAPLASRLAVESRLPIYRNTRTALLVFERADPGHSLRLTLSFREQTRGSVPAGPSSVLLSGPVARHEESIDIAAWPDGEYAVAIAEAGREDEVLVRAIRKETILPPTPPDGPLPVAGHRIFLVDDWYLDQVEGLRRVVHPAEQFPIEPWRGAPEYRFIRNSIREFHVGSDGAFYVQILAENTLGGADARYWAASRDLRDWEIVPTPAQPHPESTSSRLDPTPQTAPKNAAYRRYDPATDGPVDLAQVRVRWSGLGRDVRWGEVPIPYRSRLALWEKPNGEALILGEPITRDKSVFRDDEIGRWTDSNDNFGNPRLSPDGTVLRCHQTRLVPRHDPFRVHYDNVLAERILVTWSTTDGLTWTPTTFDAPTLEDPWSTQHYGVDVWEEENGRLQMAYLRIYDAQTQRVSTHLAHSRDGLCWIRPREGGPFLDNGPRGTFHFGYAITTGNRVRTSWNGSAYEPMQGINVLHFMFLPVYRRPDRSQVTAAFLQRLLGGRLAGPKGVETSPVMAWFDSWEEIAAESRGQVFTPALMRYRLDGWIGARPSAERAAITTKPLLASGGLRLNARTDPGGSVRVNVLDAEGGELAPYCGPNAASFRGDETSAPLTWSGGALTELPGGPFRLRLVLDRAELFTLGF